jgi:hypothetical protein
MLTNTLALIAGAMSIALAACAPYPLHANMLDAEFHAVLSRHFRPGMSQAEVHAALDDLRVSRRDRLLYDTNPPQLLARVYQPGGRFIHQDDQTIEWVDTWFVFGGGRGELNSLSRWYTRRGSQRYFHGEPVYAPPLSETAGPTRRYPFSPPPPAQPPEPNE